MAKKEEVAVDVTRASEREATAPSQPVLVKNTHGRYVLVSELEAKALLARNPPKDDPRPRAEVVPAGSPSYEEKVALAKGDGPDAGSVRSGGKVLERRGDQLLPK